MLASEGRADDVKQGTLHAIDAAGMPSPWREDPEVSREWSDWQRSRTAGGNQGNGQSAGARAQASVIQADFKGIACGIVRRLKVHRFSATQKQITRQLISFGIFHCQIASIKLTVKVLGQLQEQILNQSIQCCAIGQ